MSIIDTVASKIMPPESKEERDRVHVEARKYSSGEDWLAMVLDTHEQIDALFENALAASGVEGRQTALKKLGQLLTGHSIAEEAVLYPALAKIGQGGDATEAYGQQAAAKTEMFLLEGLDPTSDDFAKKLEHTAGAVRHHVYREEGDMFPTLAQSEQVDQGMLTKRYAEEFGKYMGIVDQS